MLALVEHNTYVSYSTCERMVGRNVACATATIVRETYDVKKTYVDGLLKILRNAAQSHVRSVILVAPRPNLLIAIYRSGL